MSKRIAVVIDPWDYPFNGTVVSTRRFVAALTASGYRFQLLALQSADLPEGDGFEQLSIPGANRIINAMRAPLAKPDRPRLRRLLKGCDLLHVQYPFFLAYAAIQEARRMDIPVICSFHVQPENILQNVGLPSRFFSQRLYRLFIRWFYQPADRVIAPSAFAADLLQKNGLKTPVTVLSNGVPARFFKIERDVERQADRRVYRLLSVGRLAREKQQETLLRAVAASRHAASIELVLAGVGPREAYLRQLADTLGVRVEIGWMDDESLLKHYGTAHVFVHAGTTELEGMSVFEAMAAGNVVIVSDAADSACGSIVQEEAARFRNGNVQSLAARIDYWLDNGEARESQGRLNRSFAQSLSHEKSAAALMDIYDQMLGCSPVGEAEAQLTGTS